MSEVVVDEGPDMQTCIAPSCCARTGSVITQSFANLLRAELIWRRWH